MDNKDHAFKLSGVSLASQHNHKQHPFSLRIILFWMIRCAVALLIYSDEKKIAGRNEEWGFPGGSVVKHLLANARDAGSNPGPGGSQVWRSS